MVRFLLLILVGLWFPTVLLAQQYTNEITLESEVYVDISSETPADVQQKAIEEAEQRGFSQLLARFTPDDRIHVLENTSPREVTAIVRGVEVLNEKIVGSRFRGTLRVLYSADGLDRIIEKRLEERPEIIDTLNTRSILVFPIYAQDGNVLLWEEDNKWREIWDELGLQRGKATILTPYADATDMQLMPTKTVLSANYKDFAPLRERYGVRDIVVLAAEYFRGEDTHLKVMQRYIGRNLNDVSELTYRADPQENQHMLMQRAASDIAHFITYKLDTGIVKEEIHSSDTLTKLLIVIPLSSISEWTDLQKRLIAIPQIDKVHLKAMAADQVDAELYYKGLEDVLEDNLKQHNINYHKHPDYWTVWKNL